MRIIQLLEQKNHYLEKFYALNDLQIRLLNDAEIDTLDEFYDRREKIIEILGYIDNQTKEAYSNLNPLDAQQNAETIQKLLFIKDEYVHRILDQEMQILAKIDDLKSSILAEIIELKSTRKALKSYHSQSTSRKLSEKV
jgi:hypothetical protein